MFLARKFGPACAEGPPNATPPETSEPRQIRAESVSVEIRPAGDHSQRAWPFSIRNASHQIFCVQPHGAARGSQTPLPRYFGSSAQWCRICVRGRHCRDDPREGRPSVPPTPLHHLRPRHSAGRVRADPDRDRGSNENTNRLLRFWFEKGSDLSVHGPEDLCHDAATLNRWHRPTLDSRPQPTG